MRYITLAAHFDGNRIMLDEPFDLPRDAPLMVTVLGTDVGEDSWSRLAESALGRAYGDDEPEYSLGDVKQ